MDGSGKTGLKQLGAGGMSNGGRTGTGLGDVDGGGKTELEQLDVGGVSNAGREGTHGDARHYH